MKQAKTSGWLAVITALLLCCSCTLDPWQSEEERQYIAEFEGTLEKNPALIDAPGGPLGTIPLHFAVSNEYMSLLRWLLAHGADVNAKDSHGETPLHEAIISDRTPRHKFISTLLENGADINALNSNGDTPLHRAASSGETTVAKLLLSHEADVNARAKQGETPLHNAVFEPIPQEGEDHRGTVELLLQHKADVDAKDIYGATPIHTAIISGNSEIVRLLLTHGADVDARNNYGWTPLHSAAVSGRADIVNLLIANSAAVNPRDQDGRTPLFRALKSPAIRYSADKKEPVDTTEVVKVLRRNGGIE